MKGALGLSFAGIQAYHGGLQHKRSLDQRQKACEKAARPVRRYIDALAQVGIACRVVTGGGTGTAVFDVASQAYTEIQSGLYAFMDTYYGGIDWGAAPAFRHSLFLLVTVISTPPPERKHVVYGKSVAVEVTLM